MTPHRVTGAAPRTMWNNQQIRRIAILGGGTAGWMAASILARSLPGTGCTITVIESSDIGIVGVGEATIPPIIELLRFLNINEADFVRYTNATYKLGIKFTGWSTLGQSYWHPFGTFGTSINLRPFHHAWHRACADGLKPRFHDFSLGANLGEAGKFLFPDPAAHSPAAGLRYALHLDARLVGLYLRSYAEKLGVHRIEGTVSESTRLSNGFLDELIFSDGRRLAAELFVDCSGFRGALIERTLNTGYVEWGDLLPCDRAVAVPSEVCCPRPPYTQASAGRAGWRWRIPLQNRTGNGYVYSSAHIGDADALDELLHNVPEKTLADPRVLHFTAGRRRLFWNYNCVALGLASGFLEPLESTSIHLVMSGVYKLLEHFPDKNFCAANRDSYNAELTGEMERIRDFLVLHYCLTRRSDTPFWLRCASLKIPESLQQRIELYRCTGRLRPRGGELFTDLSWFYIFEGMGIRPEHYDPLLDVVSPRDFRNGLSSLAQSTAEAAHAAPTHDSYFPGEPR